MQQSVPQDRPTEGGLRKPEAVLMSSHEAQNMFLAPGMLGTAATLKRARRLGTMSAEALGEKNQTDRLNV